MSKETGKHTDVSASGSVLTDVSRSPSDAKYLMSFMSATHESAHVRKFNKLFDIERSNTG